MLLEVLEVALEVLEVLLELLSLFKTHNPCKQGLIQSVWDDIKTWRNPKIPLPSGRVLGGF